jgi:hypothetical protein
LLLADVALAGVILVHFPARGCPSVIGLARRVLDRAAGGVLVSVRGIVDQLAWGARRANTSAATLIPQDQ